MSQANGEGRDPRGPTSDDPHRGGPRRLTIARRHPAPADYTRWLERGEAERLPIDLLRPYEAEAMRADAGDAAVGT